MRAPRATAYARSLEQRISLITLGVNNVERSRRFYEELGWTGQLLEETVFFQAGGQAVVLWDWQKLAADAGVVDDGSNFGGIVLAHNVRSRPGVDELIQRAASAGATITRHPSEMFYGGYAGCFRDVDGHVWEIAINPGFPLDELGNLTVPWTWETALVSDTETVWMIAVGVVGLAGFVAGSYLYATPRDWARFGLMMLQRGEWQGRQVLSRDFAALMAAKSAADPVYGQGMVWQEGPGDEVPGADLAYGLPDDTFWFLGHDGQSTAVVPSAGLVVVRMGLTPSDRGYRPQKLVAALIKALAPS